MLGNHILLSRDVLHGSQYELLHVAHHLDLASCGESVSTNVVSQWGPPSATASGATPFICCLFTDTKSPARGDRHQGLLN